MIKMMTKMRTIVTNMTLPQPDNDADDKDNDDSDDNDVNDPDGVDDLYIIGAVCDVFAYFFFSLF